MHKIRLDFGENRRAAQLEMEREPDTILRDFLSFFPARSVEQIPSTWLDMPLRAFQIVPVNLPARVGHTVRTPNPISDDIRQKLTDSLQEETRKRIASLPIRAFPPTLSDSEAIGTAYEQDIKMIARYLSLDLSVLVICDKALVEHIYRPAVSLSGKEAVLEYDDRAEDSDATSVNNNHTENTSIKDRVNLLATTHHMMTTIKPNQVLVLRHLDILAARSAHESLPSSLYHLTEILYHHHEFTPILLAFADPSLLLPEVLTHRFAMRVEITGLRYETMPRLITATERERLEQFDLDTLFNHVSGFNAIEFRNAMRYITVNTTRGIPLPTVIKLLRQFKCARNNNLQIPQVTFNDIGGYVRAKEFLFTYIEQMTGIPIPFHADGKPYPTIEMRVSEESIQERKQRRRLAPRGFVLYGPPGTGKTLFAEAIANVMNATMQIINQSTIISIKQDRNRENLHNIFALARRNAPSVIILNDLYRGTPYADNSPMQDSSASNTILMQLLDVIERCAADQEILVVAIVRSLHHIDTSLIGPLRLQPIAIDLPTVEERQHIINIHITSKKVPGIDDHIFAMIAQETEGFSGYDIHMLLQRVVLCMRRGEIVTQQLFEQEIGAMKQLSQM